MTFINLSSSRATESARATAVWAATLTSTRIIEVAETVSE